MNLAKNLLFVLGLVFLAGGFVAFAMEPEFGFGAIVAVVFGLIGLASVLTGVAIVLWLRRQENSTHSGTRAV